MEKLNKEVAVDKKFQVENNPLWNYLVKRFFEEYPNFNAKLNWKNNSIEK